VHLRRRPADLVGGAARGVRGSSTWQYPTKTDLPAAHERTGIPPEALELLDVAVEIPMVGHGASLNVAVAGSLVLYRLAGLL
jgi:tRNA G18 (ribose-2'-O)-methylase SpoU